MQFQNTTLSAEMLQAIATQNFTEMTEIQAKTIPLLLEGKDVIGKSNTGTGKTAAFSIPIIEQIPKDAEPFVYALILCPTRELAMQACEEIGKFAKFKRWVKPVAVYGGASMERQIHALKNGANIVVGTPGRVLDHLRRRTLKLEHLRTIVLDEADEMLNMGFREDIESVLAQTPEDRQTVLFSATMPPAILAITKQYQKDPQMVQIQSPHRTVDAIAQYAINVPMGRKTDALHLLLASKKPVSSMVFCNTKKMVDELTEALQNRGFAAVGLHGDMKQMQRTQVMNSFKNGRCNILIATDVAARGIDVKGVDAVFNYDLPQDHEYYIHRIGRTGRAGKEGTAYNIISGRKQEQELRAISQYTRANIEELNLPTSAEMKQEALDQLQQRLQEQCSSAAPSEEAVQLAEQLIAAGTPAETLLAMLLQEEITAATKNLPTFDIPKPIRKGKRSGAATVKLHINVGRKERMAPNFILGALVEATELSGSEFGKIDIYDKFTTVEVPAAEASNIVASMQSTKINGHAVKVKLFEERSNYRSGGGRSGNGRSDRFRRDHAYSSKNNSGSYNRKKRRG